MFNFDKSDIQRIAVSSIGALAMAATSVLAAAGPAKAATTNAPLTVGDWQGSVQRQLDSRQDAMVTDVDKVRNVMIAARFTADGDYAGASLIRSSGDVAIDGQAVRLANRLTYPALPAGYRGRPQLVTLKLFFGNDAAAVQRARKAQVEVDYAQIDAGKNADSKVAAR